LGKTESLHRLADIDEMYLELSIVACPKAVDTTKSRKASVRRSFFVIISLPKWQRLTNVVWNVEEHSLGSF